MQITSPLFDECEIESVRRCLQSGVVGQGPLVAEFEKRVAAVHEVRHALATTSCTAALHLATLALGLGPGDEVVVPAFTWITSANSAEYVGARAVFADINAETFNLGVEEFEAAITSRTRAVVAVHLFGLAADMDRINAIARRKGISVIEDAACAIGTTYHGRPIGAIGDIGCFSFHPRKVVTTGEGGMVTTDSDEIAGKVRRLRGLGFNDEVALSADASNRPEFERIGFDLRLSDIQAAIGLAQMDKFKALLAERRALANRYLELLAGADDLALPVAGDRTGHSYQSFVVRVREGGRSRRNTIMKRLAEHDIQTRPGTHAVHRLGYYANKYGLRPEQFPVAASSEDTTITLPIFPGMTESQQNTVTRIVVSAIQQSNKIE